MKPFPFHGCNDTLKPFLDKILSGHEYSPHEMKFDHQPIVIDAGANVGAYSYWILSQIPGAFVFAYEPDATNASNYIKNMTESEIPSSQWRLFQGCISAAETPTVNLYHSTVNSGMHSLQQAMTNTDNAAVTPVVNFRPSDLPNCDILKIDTEGCEVEILKNFLPNHVPPSIISLEFHSSFDLYEIEQLLKDYIISTADIVHPNLGTINYIHKSKVV